MVRTGEKKMTEEMDRKYRELIVRIDEMDVSAAKRFELNMMANCARYIEDVMLRKNRIPDLAYASEQLDQLNKAEMQPMTEKQHKELAQQVTDYLRKRYGKEFTDNDAVRIYDFVMQEADQEIPYPTSQADIENVAMEFELRYG